LKVERYPAYAPAYAQGQNDRPNDTDDWYENDVSYQTTADYGDEPRYKARNWRQARKRAWRARFQRWFSWYD
ncbi:MAG: hypothetical protein ACR2O4_14915, partial [Hyphomicrobiaceae bacterium]